MGHCDADDGSLFYNFTKGSQCSSGGRLKQMSNQPIHKDVGDSSFFSSIPQISSRSIEKDAGSQLKQMNSQTIQKDVGRQLTQMSSKPGHHCDADDGPLFYIFTNASQCSSGGRLKQMSNQPIHNDVGDSSFFSSIPPMCSQPDQKDVGRHLTQMNSQLFQNDVIDYSSFSPFPQMSQPIQEDVGGPLMQMSNQPIGHQLTQMVSQPNQKDVDNNSYLSSFPPGYRFLPTDSELVVHYLAKKIHNQPLQPNRIVDTELYKFHPEELIKNTMQGDGPWYFFTPRDKKYPKGSRPSRSARLGYWKATVKDKDVLSEDNIRIGFKRSLVFYEGKARRGIKTKWMMHEYKLDKPPKRQGTRPQNMRLDDCVLCKIYQKNKKKEESDDECNFSSGQNHKEREDTNSKSPEILMGQNIDNYGDAGGELPAATFEQVYMQCQNINSGDIGGVLPVDPLQHIYVHVQNNIYNYGDTSGELSAAPIDNYGDHGGELLVSPLQQVYVHGQNLYNYGDAVGELPATPLEQYQNIANNYGDAGGKLSDDKH